MLLKLQVLLGLQHSTYNAIFRLIYETSSNQTMQNMLVKQTWNSLLLSSVSVDFYLLNLIKYGQ
jgi:hypothetical protein